MLPILDALSNPFSWILVEAPYSGLALRHPDGHAVRVSAVMGTWAVQAGPGTTSIAQVPVQSRPETVEDFQKDLDRCFGPEARASLHRVLREIRVNLASRGIREKVYLAREPHSTRFGMLFEGPKVVDNVVADLPPFLKQALRACAHVLHPVEDQDRIDARSCIPLVLPTTAHAAMAFVQQARETTP